MRFIASRPRSTTGNRRRHRPSPVYGGGPGRGETAVSGISDLKLHAPPAAFPLASLPRMTGEVHENRLNPAPLRPWGPEATLRGNANSPRSRIHGTDVEGRRAAGCPRRSHQGQRPDQVRQGRARSLAHRAGDRRLLGAVVRAVQAAAAGDRKGRQGGQRRGQAGQDQHRPEPDAGPAAAHPVDPGGLRLLRRPPGRRLHGRGAREPGQAVRRPPGAGDRRRGGRRRR